MSRHKTARGKEFNMAAFSQANSTSTAVGNVRRNAAGDVLDDYGNIIATAKSIQTSYYNKSYSKVQTMGIKEDISMPTVQSTAVKKSKAAGASIDSVKEYTDENGTELKEVTYLDGSIEIVKK